MYLKFYRPREFPFTLGSDGRFFYESAIHAEALANMAYTIQQRKGMVLITGEVGAGKTFVGGMLGSRLGPGCMMVSMQDPPESRKQLLRAFADRIGVQTRPSDDKQILVAELKEYLIRLHNRGRLIGLIMDESQSLSDRSLDEIRLMWNWECNAQRLVQIVLIGQPELQKRLQEPKWEPLLQRIVLSYHMRSLSADDTAAYIRHRLAVASEDGSLVDFTPDGLQAVYAATDGIPRLINVLCDNALLTGYAKEQTRIDRNIITEVLQGMTCWGLRVQSNEAATAASG